MRQALCTKLLATHPSQTHVHILHKHMYTSFTNAHIHPSQTHIHILHKHNVHILHKNIRVSFRGVFASPPLQENDLHVVIGFCACVAQTPDISGQLYHYKKLKLHPLWNLAYMLVFCRIILTVIELYIKVKDGCASALHLLPQFVSLLLSATLLILVFESNFLITCSHFFYIIKVLMLCWHLSYFSVYVFDNLNVCNCMALPAFVEQ